MTVRVALPAHAVHFAPTLAMTHLIELAGHVETLREAVPDYVAEHDNDVAEAMERSARIMEWLGQHALTFDDIPAGQVAPPNANSHSPNALIETMSGLTSVSAYIGHPISITHADDHAIRFTDAERDRHVTIPWVYAATLRASTIAELIASDMSPEMFEPGHAGALWRRLEAVRTGQATTGGMEELSGVVPFDEQVAQRDEDAEADGWAMRQQINQHQQENPQ
ncbi:MAG: hypothetical protein AAGG38_07340 [Planctomycetota bacterium]